MVVAQSSLRPSELASVSLRIGSGIGVGARVGSARAWPATSYGLGANRFNHGMWMSRGYAMSRYDTKRQGPRSSRGSTLTKRSPPTSKRSPPAEQSHAQQQTPTPYQQPTNPPLPQEAPSNNSFFQFPTASSSSSWASYNSIPSYPSNHPQPFQPAPETAGADITLNVPPDPDGVIPQLGTTDDRGGGAGKLLAQRGLVVTRQLEMMNLFIGYEQSNKYAIVSPSTGAPLAYLAEEESGFGAVIARQALRTHRAFKATVMDTSGRPILQIRRPFSFINSRIFVSFQDPQTGEETVIGEVQQEWHLWRRRYNLFLRRLDSNGSETYSQFARIDGGFLTWDFILEDGEGKTIASVNRNFAGLGREFFTDTGQYVLSFENVVQELLASQDSSSSPLTSSSTTTTTTETDVNSSSKLVSGSLTLDQRAVMLASAVSIDFDYFSRHSGGPGMFPLFFLGGGDDDE